MHPNFFYLRSRFASKSKFAIITTKNMALEPKRSKHGATKYKTKFNNAWTETYPIHKVYGEIYKFFCIPCSEKLSCDHQGIKDVASHCKSESHQTSKKQASLTQFLPQHASPFKKKVLNGQLIITSFLV